MPKIPFKVSARTAKLIGLENFANAEGAIIELVKNTYDADSNNCIVVYDLSFKTIENENSEVKVIDKDNCHIYIIDNGIGMTDDIIENQWMTIGTDDKLYSHTSEGGRVKTGAKGIGRFALNRLGITTELWTVSEETKEGYYWKVEWNDFDVAGTVVSQVNADLEDREDLMLKEMLLKKFQGNQRILEVLNVNNFETGTIIKISNLNDSWEANQLDNLFGNLEILLPPKEQSDFDIHFFATSRPEDFGKVKSAFYDDFDYKISAEYLDDEEKTFNIKLIRNELDVDIIEKKYKEVFDFEKMSEFPYRLEDFNNETIELNLSLNDVLSSDVDNELIEKVGKFDFTFYYLKNTISDDKQEGDIAKKYPYKKFNSSNRKSWLKKFGGIKIFRDDFRIRPYGENGEDWLKLGERQAQSPGGAGQKLGGYRIRPNQISGTINISRIHNASFQDKSGREGIIENDVFDLFRNMLLEIIGIFEDDRNLVMYHFSKLYKKRNEEAEAKRKAQEEAERINQEQEENASNEQEESSQESHSDPNANKDSENSNEDNERGSTETEKSLAKGVKILTQEIEDKDEEIRLLRNFASVGLIISSFAHEVKSLRSRLVPRTSFLVRELKKHLKEKDFKEVNINDNPFYMIKLIQDEDTKLKHWLDYSLNTLKRDKRERTNLNFGSYFESFKSNWIKAVDQRNVSIKLNGTNDDLYTIRAFEVDMDSIFNNLLSNSLNAFRAVKKEEKCIKIDWKRENDKIIITFSDNGKGLDRMYRKNPENIFRMLESSKRDKKGEVIGTGLGLYIVQSVVSEYNNSSISIMGFEEGFSLQIEFQIRKNS